MRLLLFFICYLFYNTSTFSLEIVFWHSMAGSLGEEVKALARDFNQSQKKFVIKPVYKGDYIESLTTFAAAVRAHQPPALIQIFEVGTATMLSVREIIKPIDELMTEHGLSLPKEDFIPPVREFYSIGGKLMAMPFNISIPIMYYNADLLAKFGYHSDNFPKTWQKLECLAKKMKTRGYEYIYTSAYPGWILIESYLAIQGLGLFETSPLHAIFDTTKFKKHLIRMQRWQKLGYFKYGGRVDDATILFTSGSCPLFSQSSGAYNSLSKLVNFHLGAALMPAESEKKRHTNVVGGAALWAVSGLTNEQYQGIAEFMQFLTKPEVQKRWHERTGYLPIGLNGIYAEIFHTNTHPCLRLAKTDLEKPMSSIHATLGPQNQIRYINDEILEAMFADLIQAPEALHQMIAGANHILLRFSKNTHA